MAITYRMNKISKQAHCGTKRLSMLISCVFLLYVSAYSMAAEPLEKISISADYMKLNLASGHSVYTGNVKITQGNVVLKGDKVTLEQSNKEVSQLTVTGKPARYKHVTEKGESIAAESEHMVYIADQHKLVMTINARLKQPDHQVSSQKIVYDTQKRIIIAGDKSGTGQPGAGTDSTGKDKQRVNITLTPKKQLQPAKPETAKPEPTKEAQPKN